MVVHLDRLTNNAADRIQTERYTMWVLQALSALALVLATLGLFAVTAFAVAQRHREFGTEDGAGAAPADLLRLVLVRGLSLASLGLVLGVAAAWGLTRFLQSVLFENQSNTIPPRSLRLRALVGGRFFGMLDAGFEGIEGRSGNGTSFRIGGGRSCSW